MSKRLDSTQLNFSVEQLSRVEYYVVSADLHSAYDVTCEQRYITCAVLKHLLFGALSAWYFSSESPITQPQRVLFNLFTSNRLRILLWRPCFPVLSIAALFNKRSSNPVASSHMASGRDRGFSESATRHLAKRTQIGCRTSTVNTRSLVYSCRSNVQWTIKLHHCCWIQRIAEASVTQRGHQYDSSSPLINVNELKPTTSVHDTTP